MHAGGKQFGSAHARSSKVRDGPTRGIPILHACEPRAASAPYAGLTAYESAAYYVAGVPHIARFEGLRLSELKNCCTDCRSGIT